jgi:uncharacterized protein involved in type VI secretion and phage assembly
MGTELNRVEVKLIVGGKECYVVKLRLAQGFNCHHTFECVVDYNDLDSKWMASPDSVFGLLGEDTVIEIKHRDGSGASTFRGVIAHVSYIGRHGAQNHIRVSGYSPTIKMDGSKTMDSFMDMTLKSIVSEAICNSGNGAEVTAQPKFTGKIDYIAQYDETCFAFINRLSRIYGEWFFYDGEQCYFGKKDSETETVTFEKEITTVDFSANLMPTKMKQYHYLVHDDDKIDKEASEPSTDNYHSVAQAKSQSFFTSEAALPSAATVLSAAELDQIAKAGKDRATAEMLVISGTSQTGKVKIGGKIKVELPEKNSEVENKSIGTFLVTSVIHEYDIKGEYINSFSAVPSTVENIPIKSVNFPKAFPQTATVKSNDDEKKLGRVKVEFQWQASKGKTTNWIRVQTPDAGKSDKVPKNRGFVFIPEKDDTVMIDFEYGDPNRPYVAGSVFSEKVSKGGDAGNRKKSIITRSGCAIILDDDNNKGSITISDPSGNTVILNGDKTITISAPDKISILSNEIYINGKNLVHIASDKLIKEESGQNIESSAVQNIDMDATNSVSINGGISIEEKSATVSVSGTKSVSVDGTIVNITGKTLTAIKGMPLTLN